MAGGILRCAVIGTGRVAQESHLPALKSLPGIEVAAVCDADAASLGRAAAAFQVPKSYASWQQLLQEGRGLDFVIVATPGFTHYEIVAAALEAELHVISEKPVTLSLEQAERLAALAEQRGRRVFVAQTYRYRPPAQRARAAMKENRLGRLLQVSVVHRSGDLFDPSEPRWYWDELSNKVLLYEYGIHLLDLAVWLAGPVRRVVSVRAERHPERNVTRHILAEVELACGALQSADLQLFAASPCSYVELKGSDAAARLAFFPHHYREDRGPSTPLRNMWENVARVAGFGAEVAGGMLRRGVPRRAIPHLRFLESCVAVLRGQNAPTVSDLASVMPTMQLLEQVGAQVYAGSKTEHPVATAQGASAKRR